MNCSIGCPTLPQLVAKLATSWQSTTDAGRPSRIALQALITGRVDTLEWALGRFAELVKKMRAREHVKHSRVTAAGVEHGESLRQSWRLEAEPGPSARSCRSCPGCERHVLTVKSTEQLDFVSHRR